MATKVINTILNLKNASMLSGLKQVEGSVNSLTGVMGSMHLKGSKRFLALNSTIGKFSGTALAGIAGMSAAFVGYSAKIGTEFESAFAAVGTIADQTQKPLGDLKNEIMDLSKQTGISASELAESTYGVISATGDTAGATKIVGDAARLAKAGLAEQGDATAVLTTAMNAYKLSANDLTGVSDSLIATQNLGVTTVGQLSQSMGKAIATGSSYGVSLSNIEAGYVALTKNGIPTAESTTMLSSMMRELGDAGSDVSEVLKDSTGQSFKQLMDDGKSLGDVLQILMDHCNGDSEAMANLWGSAEAGTAASAMASQGLGQFNDWLSQIQNSSGATQTAYDQMMGTFESRMSVLQTTVQGIGTTFWTDYLSGPAGEAIGQLTTTLQTLDFGPLMESLSGVVTGGINLLTDALTFLAQHGSEVIPFIQQVVTQIVAIKAATTVVSGVHKLYTGFKMLKTGVTVVTTALSLLNPPLGLIRAAMVILPPIIILIVSHWKQLMSAFQNFLNKHPKIKAAFDAVKGAINALTAPLKTVAGWIGKVIGGAEEAKTAVGGVKNSASTSRSSAGSTMAANASGTPYFGGGWTRINERGGEIAYLPGGTKIVPHDRSLAMAAAGGGRGYSVSVTILGNVVGNEEFADQVGEHVVNAIKEAYDE